MCPFFSPFVFLILIIGPFILLASAATSWTVVYNPMKLVAQMHSMSNITVVIENLNYTEIVQSGTEMYVKSDNVDLVNVNYLINKSTITKDGKWNGNINVDAIFLGTANIYVELNKSDNLTEKSNQQLPVVVVREERIIDHVFTGSVAALVSILYINFGAALDVSKLRGILVKPIGPAIGFFCQFFLMPITSYVLGLLIFPHNVAMQLGLFFTGVSPGGGASNIWTIILGGNMDLSIAITTISTIAAFGMMPLWLFTLGKTIFDKGNLQVPYKTLSTYVVALIVPLAIGLLIQRYLPRIARFLTRILKTLSVLLIVFIIVFAITTNLYLFKLFSWEIIVAGLLLPWLGFTFGYILGKLCRQSTADILAIAIDTGIQNTGIAIFILRLTLEQPHADLTTVIPVSVAIMTPVPLLLLYLGMKIRDCILFNRSKSFIPITEETTNSLN